MRTSAESPGVIARPPLLYGAAFVVVLLLRWLYPWPIFDRGVALWAGVTLLVLGVGVALWGGRTMLAAGTNVDPSLPTTAIVTSGPFRFSRNPLYLALTLVYLGLTLAFNAGWGLVLLGPVLLVMHRGVVMREERYLDRKFGEIYRQYRSKVRRYL